MIQSRRSDAEACNALPCRELVDLAEEFFGLRLPALEQARFEAHLADCSSSRAYLKQVCRMSGGTDEPRVGTIPPAVRTKLVAAFRTRPRA